MKKVRLYLLFIATASFALLSPAQTALAALSPSDYIGQGIYHYGNESVCAGGGTLNGNNNRERVFNYLVSKGLNAAQASGIMGNIQQESGFNPFRMQNMSDINTVLPTKNHSEYHYAFGLVQWDGGRRQRVLDKLAEKFPSYVTDINTYGKTGDNPEKAGSLNDSYLSFELDYVFEELSGPYKAALDGIKAQPDNEAGARESSMIWDRKYEISDGSGARADKAAEVYAEFKDKASNAANGSSSSCSGTPAGSIVYYSQLDEKWANSPYAGDTIRNVGCGPTSMAMILAALVDKTITPVDVAANAGQQSGGTSSHQNLINGVKAKWPVDITPSMTLDQAIDFIKSGKGFVWAGGTGAPPFTKGGHMVALVGITSDGKITVADPVGDNKDGSGNQHQRMGSYTKAELQATIGSMYGVSKKVTAK